MNGHTHPLATRYLPHVVVVTALVVVLPIAVVWWLRAGGVISSPWVCVALALALSLAASIAGGAYWKRRRSPRDLLFSELLLWGWLRRLWIEHQVSKAIESLSHGKPRNEDAGADRSSTFLTRLAAAVDALVMVPDDRGDLGVVQGRDHVGADVRVSLDQGVLGARQPARLVEHLRRDVELADVVHRGRRPDLGQLLA